MQTLISFIARISFILYVLIATGVFFSIRRLFVSRQYRRVAVFGLEKEKAQNDQRAAINAIIALLIAATAVYAVTNIIEPNVNFGQEEMITPTPEIFVAAAPTATPAIVLYPTITPTPGLPPAEAEAASVEDEGEPIDGCAIIGSNITVPEPGQNVSGQVQVEGEANVFDFAQYKFEVKGDFTGNEWVVVGTFNTPRTGFLGTWDSTSLAPGNYILRMVVSQSSGNIVTPCEVPIVIGQAAPQGQ